MKVKEFEDVRTNRLADAVVYRMINHQTKAAVREALDKTEGKGCGCASCVSSAVARANSWLELATKGNLDDDHKFSVVDVGGKIKAVRGEVKVE